MVDNRLVQGPEADPVDMDQGIALLKKLIVHLGGTPNPDPNTVSGNRFGGNKFGGNKFGGNKFGGGRFGASGAKPPPMGTGPGSQAGGGATSIPIPTLRPSIDIAKTTQPYPPGGAHGAGLFSIPSSYTQSPSSGLDPLASTIAPPPQGQPLSPEEAEKLLFTPPPAGSTPAAPPVAGGGVAPPPGGGAPMGVSHPAPIQTMPPPALRPQMPGPPAMPPPGGGGRAPLGSMSPLPGSPPMAPPPAPPPQLPPGATFGSQFAQGMDPRILMALAGMGGPGAVGGRR
jgi:hypothetical protein